MVKFIPLTGDPLGVFHNENYRIMQTVKGDITFSYTMRGKGMDCHFAARKTALRALKQTINSFCDWLFKNYEWCECIFAIVSKPSVGRLIKKCGFTHMANDEKENKIYTRTR